MNAFLFPIYFIFFISGAAGLIYEIVWTRLLVVIFGGTTNSVVAVVAAFLGGLAIGSFLFGRYADKVEMPTVLLRLYAFLEFGVALTALLSPLLLNAIVPIYAHISDGSEVTFSLLVVKFLLTMLVILVPTILMGATLPVLVSFVTRHTFKFEEQVSMLYAVNTAGGVVGVLVSGLLLIEMFGLYGTLYFGVILNVSAALGALFLRARSPVFSVGGGILVPPASPDSAVNQIAYPYKMLVLGSLGISGFIAIAYQVLWVRMLTPLTGTFTYAVAVIFALYIAGIALGSLLYLILVKRWGQRVLYFAVSEAGIGICAMISVFVMHSFPSLSRHLLTLLVIAPATVCMGVAFPAAVSILKGGGKEAGFAVGRAYFYNTIGAIVGGFCASFVLIPFIGSSQSVLLLSLGNMGLAAILFWNDREIMYFGFYRRVFTAGLGVLSVFLSYQLLYNGDSLYEHVTQSRINHLRYAGAEFDFREDNITSVFAFRDRQSGQSGLFVNGIETAGKVMETKLMAHVPYAIHPNPTDMLIIGFGVGTTFRSSLQDGMYTDVVELSPTVPRMFHFFYEDAVDVLRNPNGRVIINDGRNYTALTDKKYDIVVIDPPPPFNATGTTVLYSKEFYQDISRILRPGAIVSQWLFGGTRLDDIGMAARSFTDTFPHVRVFVNPGNVEGVFLIGSFDPIVVDEKRVRDVFIYPHVVADLAEARATISGDDVLRHIVTDNSFLSAVGEFRPVTDSHPRTEYFLLRSWLSDFPNMSAVWPSIYHAMVARP